VWPSLFQRRSDLTHTLFFRERRGNGGSNGYLEQMAVNSLRSLSEDLVKQAQLELIRFEWLYGYLNHVGCQAGAQE
jgi:hypothetical protein